MRVLSKSRFKLGLECPNKLYYTGKKEYANAKDENTFLEALADGGFQIEELARLHYPNGILLEGDGGDYELLWKETSDLLKEETITLYEPAFLFNGLFARIDILVKKGNHIELIEVKAKSFDPDDANLYIGKRGRLVSEWKPYLFDVAFQKYVMQSCFPNWKIDSYLMMADKSKTASIDGLNQLFRITNDDNIRTGIHRLVTTLEETGTSVLERTNVSAIIADIETNKHVYHPELTFQEAILQFAKNYAKDLYFNWPTSYSACRNCEFKTSADDDETLLKSGYETCFKKQHEWTATDFKKPSIFDIWNFRKGGSLFKKGKFFMEDLSKDDIGYQNDDGRLSFSERHWLQIEKEIHKDDSIYLDKPGLRKEISNWVFPLHFIDFETSAAALPFNKGRKPYEQIAFQFSHHIYYENGTIKHDSEYINNTAGFFPNFEFIRNLKKVLENDEGTIFRYHNHENTILNVIYLQLMESDETDKNELMQFIQHVTHSTNSSPVKWKGDRDMVDLYEVILYYYYNPLTRGSNSIKDVLPAVLKKSKFLQKKYSQKLKDIHLSSKNFSKEHVWLLIENGKVTSPYKMLPPIFENWSEEDIEKSISELTDISEGGAALTAYGKLQYTDMGQAEIDEITAALLKYCELDTLAMIMIYEHLIELLIKT